MSLQQKCAEFFEEQGGVRKKQVREIRPKLGWTKKEIEALKVSFLSSPLAFSFNLHLCFNVINFLFILGIVQEGILEQLASQNYRATKTISWMNILKKYKDVFHPKRVSKDLENKFVIDKTFEQIRYNNMYEIGRAHV